VLAIVLTGGRRMARFAYPPAGNASLSQWGQKPPRRRKPGRAAGATARP